MPMLQCSECKREVFTLVDGMCLRCKEPEAYRNFTDQFSVCPVCKRSYLTHTFERVGDSEPMCWNCADLARESMPKCLECHRCVFTLVEGMCFVCHAPVDGKPLRDMTKAQMSEPHTCGVTGRQHVDGMDGNWLDCDEAKRRLGR
jgi:hypothetical protein